MCRVGEWNKKKTDRSTHPELKKETQQLRSDYDSHISFNTFYFCAFYSIAES